MFHKRERLMDCFIALASSIKNTDESLRYSYVTNVKSTTYLAFTLMDLQESWTSTLESDRTSAVEASMQPDGGAAAMAQAWNFKYQTDSDNKDMQCGQWQTLVQACLLYTSPSPRDRTRSRMPSSA